MSNVYGKFIMILFIVSLVIGESVYALPIQANTNPQKATSVDIEKAKALYEKALSIEDLSEKKRLCLEAIKVWPGFAQAYNNLEDVYEKQKHFEEAIKEYEIASALAPTAPYPYLGLGNIYFKLGRYELAAANYEKRLRIESDDKSAIERLRLSRIPTTKILFSFNSYKLTGKAIEQLTLIAKALSSPEFEDTVFEIQGHTDSAGPKDYNLRLSQRRAEGVKKYLVEKCGISPESLIVR